jgi:hypothetical protein
LATVARVENRIKKLPGEEQQNITVEKILYIIIKIITDIYSNIGIKERHLYSDPKN